jgi:hypothetical protein
VTKKDCVGCRDNFYNSFNLYGIKDCWSFDKKKKLETKYELSIHTPMNIKSAYLKVKVPDCYHKQGYVLCKKIPDYAR